MQNIQRYPKKGFTLAEVLITLTIIGVIAALTIPSLIQNIQDAQYKTAWKKEYSVTNQAFTRLLSDQGGTLQDLCPSVGWVQDSRCIRDELATYLSVQKTCAVSLGFGCWHPNDGSSKYLSGAPMTIESNYPGLVLNDGSLMYFSYGNASCSVTTYSHVNNCVTISVDINGFNGPNIYGKDIFRMVVYPTQIRPFGTDNDTFGCSGYGYGCSATYLLNQ